MCSYMFSGSKASLIRNKVEKIYFEMRSEKKSTESNANSSSASSKGSNSDGTTKKEHDSSASKVKLSKTPSKDSKPKVVTVNKQKSAFSDKSYPESVSDTTNTVQQLKGSNSVNGSSQNVKRKKYVISSDSDSDLDFGGECSVIKKRKALVEKESGNCTTPSRSKDFIAGVKNRNPVVIESSSGDEFVT